MLNIMRKLTFLTSSVILLLKNTLYSRQILTKKVAKQTTKASSVIQYLTYIEQVAIYRLKLQ